MEKKPIQFKVFRLDMGDKVICDNCNADVSNSPKSGGFIIGSRGWCPECESESRALLRKYGEEHLITAVCPADMSHADWIRSIR